MLLLEAMALGLPVVSTLAGAPQEFLKPGVNTTCFAGGDAEDLARCLGLVLTDAALRERQAAAAARALIETAYNVDRSVEAIRALVARIARGEAGAFAAELAPECEAAGVLFANGGACARSNGRVEGPVRVVGLERTAG